MAKAQWKDLLPCKICHKIVKNAQQLRLDDRVAIELFKENVDLNESSKIIPYHTLKLDLSCVIRPGAQQHRMIKPLLSEKSLTRCHGILAENRMDYYKNLWFSNHTKQIKVLNEDSKVDKQWCRDKKKEFKHFYKSLTDQSVHYGKSCYVDFYLSANDNHGLIAKINKKMKLRFLIDSNNNKKYLADSMPKPAGTVHEVQINHFIVSIYSKEKLLLKINGDVQIINKTNNVSLEHLIEQGFEYPYIAGNYV